MNKIVLSCGLLLLATLCGALYFTNPNEKDYAQYLSQVAAEDVEASVCQPEGLTEWLGKIGEAISNACQGIVAGGKSLSEEEIQTIIIDSTDYKNRILFSTYVTESPFGNYRAIGFLDRFVLREQSES